MVSALNKYDIARRDTTGKTLKEKESRRWAILLTSITVIMVLSILLFFGIPIMNPPFGDGEGIGGGAMGGGMEVALGNSDNGSGGPTMGVKAGGNSDQPTEPEHEDPKPEESTPVTPPVENNQAEETDKTEDVTSPVKPKVEPKKETPKREPEKPAIKPVVTTPAKTEPVKTPEKAVEQPVNKARRTFGTGGGSGGSGGTANSQGNGTGSGEQGKANGTRGNTNFNGSGGTTSGSGGGSGNDIGPGPGGDGGLLVGGGLKGRRMVKKPELVNNTEKEGKIVFQIEVDPSGNVVSVRGGIRGTTIPDQGLINLNEARIKAMKFAPNPDVDDIQTGTLTVTFSSK